MEKFKTENRAALANPSATTLKTRGTNLKEIEVKELLNMPMSWKMPFKAITKEFTVI